MDIQLSIDRYAALRRRLERLDASGESFFSGEAETLDTELVELEDRLPANCAHPGDQPLPPGDKR